MRILKIGKPERDTWSLIGCTCVECFEKEARAAVKIGGHTSALCNDCLRSLGDMTKEAIATIEY